MVTFFCLGKIPKMFEFFLILLLLFCSGCSGRTQCSAFPERLEVLSLPVYSLPNANLRSSAFVKAIDLVDHCYPKSPYYKNGHELIFNGVKKYRDGGSFIIYSLYGIDDLRIAFFVTNEGVVSDAYQFGL